MSSEIHPKMYMYRRIVEAKLFIDQHYDQKIELDNISDQACFSKYHFLRLFKQVYGMSPHKYLTSVRLNKAKALLDKQMPVSDVCFDVGFDSLPSFSSLFKRQIGMSPKAYAEQAQQHKQAAESAPLQFVPGCFVENYGWNK